MHCSMTSFQRLASHERRKMKVNPFDEFVLIEPFCCDDDDYYYSSF